ncbi:sorbitol dehydrogenase family protein [Rouxiella sp. T17]|uniref:sorbitol dehydrogenase family protein n=1 Tax=Rouxiella sp. T17 TaxID=3085684 RepID=UPI002FCA2E69
MKNNNNSDGQSELSANGRSRRSLISRSSSVIASFALVSGGLSAVPALAAENKPDNKNAAADLAAFIKLSRLLTGHNSLDVQLGERLYLALCQHDGQFSAQVKQLIAFAEQNNIPDVETLDEKLKQQPLHEPMMSIIKAWYSGVIEPGYHARVYGYQQALMYQVSRDGMVIPTYAHNGPDYWVANPPPVDRLLTF